MHITRWMVWGLLSWGALLAQSPAGVDSLSRLEARLYDITLLQVEQLLLTSPPEDSLAFDLLEDARELAAGGQWNEGRELLSTILELYAASEDDLSAGDVSSESGITDAPASLASPAAPATTAQFQVETGVDYSLQEFELALETDPTLTQDTQMLTEELRNPYVVIGYFQPLSLGGRSLWLNHRLRVDNEFGNYNLYATLENRAPRQITRLEWNGNFFVPFTSGESGFLDNQLSYFLGNAGNAPQRWYTEVRGRWKWYPHRDSLSSDILSASATVYYEQTVGAAGALSFAWRPAYYRASGNLGNRYFQNRISLFYDLREQVHRYLEVGVDGVYHTFENDPGALDANGQPVTYRNRYFALEPRLEWEWPVAKGWGLAAEGEVEVRRYATADEINPNYTRWFVEGQYKWYPGEMHSVGLGMNWERQTHQAEEAADQVFAEQADFEAYGPVISMEYITFTGWLIQLEYRLQWRNYPRAGDTILNSFYSDRLMHSIQLFGWIPLGSGWQIQLFANYDNDRDREFQENDTRNTIVNLGVIYSF
ncbi:MAG: hypothetical protein D6681_04500 [Calditrichaeota bacterium]|nr:MAG: hypothetical protein D6681_04500 [Calditrichota bacterium]